MAPKTLIPFLAFALLMTLVSGAWAQAFFATPSVPVRIATATTTNVIAGVTGSRTFLTVIDLHAGAADNVSLEYGDDASCTNPHEVAAWNFSAGDGDVEGNGTGTILYIPSGKYTCLVTSSTGPLTGHITYAQTGL